MEDLDTSSELDLSCLLLSNFQLKSLSAHFGFNPINIRKLVLRNNSLKELPSSISDLCNLQELDASSNQISWISGEIFCLKQINKLELRNNQLQTLPKEFENCSSLKILNLGGNLFTDIPPPIFNLKGLQKLFLGGNKIAVLPPQIEKLTRLEVLYLGGNLLKTVCPNLGKLKHLKQLVLCDNQLEVIPQEFGFLKSLESLSLHQNYLKTLPMGILSLVNLQELTLRDNPLVNTFIKKLEFNPPTLLEICGRCIKKAKVPYTQHDLPRVLCNYLNSAQCCVNPKCDGVYFDSRVKCIKFVDFCGKYRLPLEQYLCSPCDNGDSKFDAVDSYIMQKVLLPKNVVESD
ncbi:leucine-rich repeat-containing protein 58 isoform X1 [Hydra vulgaris]|uniref:Leucine-rich repeat-containing protein 58 n=1 Tax=Hydra vulgaris TaxID=6087 RepID=T2M8B8_HYDVU|nr:leucine-rich repeat-containing protein 58 [Hydra vulgaris]